jgi:hypothetical protein
MRRALMLELCLAPDWDRIDDVRQAVSLCVAAVFGQSTLNESLSMVSAELLENAVKYGKPHAAITLAIDEAPDRVTVEVTNDVERDSRHAAALNDQIAWLTTFDDPAKAYLAALERAYREACEGGLGLVRVAYEGRCSVESDTTTPGRVRVRATCRLPLGVHPAAHVVARA